MPLLERFVGTRRERLFFALWPTAEQQAHWHRQATLLAEHCGGRIMRANSLHLTLAFLGDIEIRHQPRLIELMTSLSCPTLELSMDRVERLRCPRI